MGDRDVLGLLSFLQIVDKYAALKVSSSDH